MAIMDININLFEIGENGGHKIVVDVKLFGITIKSKEKSFMHGLFT